MLVLILLRDLRNLTLLLSLGVLKGCSSSATAAATDALLAAATAGALLAAGCLLAAGRAAAAAAFCMPNPRTNTPGGA
jgi:hypothetical protein